ncbi:cyclic beta-1,2-glucan synthetase [Roseiarcus fermentans]|uniref:Cyclic beta-1,2-glucan synthetase n=1 Tax=Roseiarcus fermentans TaxID=1473586 RepID=A0A366F8H7_9HYPH|nr:glucoamylase family protein [Roseiarcus fermentans]RBP10416.1 cyclic beta-1,2-glucan synthetase [Roseiarcus fermentans]
MNLELTAKPTIPAHRFRGFFKGQSPWDSEKPIREELFSVDRLEAHGKSLAIAQTVASGPTRGRSLTARLAENGAVLLSSYRSIVKAIDDGRQITPAGEWLIDNFHLVERQIRQISTDLPPGYYRQLPKLVTGPFADYPRVFGMAWAFVAHTDSCFDADILVSYVNAYQKAQPLTIGELWAVSITLQIVLIENLRRLAQNLTSSRTARHEADRLADRLLGVNGRASEPASVVFAGRGAKPISEAFAVELVHRLRDQDPRFTPALAWLDERLAKQGLTADSAVREVHRSQGAANVTVRNIVTSLRMIAEVDWQVLFERYCLVDDVLASHCAFHDMDFATRNLYRSAIEDLARRSDHDELEIARLAVAAGQARDPSCEPSEQLRRSDPGYHLLTGGRLAFEASVGLRWFRGWPARRTPRTIFDAYATAILVASAIVLAAPLIALAKLGLGPTPLTILAALGAICAIDAGLALVNRGVAVFIRPVALPGLELRSGVPESLRTLVAVPTLLTTPEDIAEQVERLEIHHLASPEGDLHFALLTDWVDADVEQAEGDQELVSAARDGIARLNRRYGPAPAGPRFLLLHRRRVWNESERRWIGWERKRGKLQELNRLLRGVTDTTFMDTDGAAPSPPINIRYVVTLDSDTRLPRDTVRRLIGKMAHPLNRPRYDAERGAIVEGYAILQPRVTASLPNGGEGSLFQRVFSSSSGIDPYAAAVSEVYQDLFCEGSYAGKGIYDVDAFESVLWGRAPDSTLLSHDLFEGTFARAAFASDVEVVDEFPSRYDVSARRHHRWARGDWQLLPWILGFASNSGARSLKDQLPRIGRWKMIDNLRRTLSAPACVFALAIGWTLPLEPALVWTTFVLATIILPSLIPVISAIPGRRPGAAMSGHLRALGADFRLAATLSALNITFLADQAWLMGDAIARTLWRLFVSRRHLLEWTPAAQSAAAKRLDLQGFAVRMSGAIVLALTALLLAILLGHRSWPVATPIVALWLISPAVARYVSFSSGIETIAKISEGQSLALRQIARRTWRFFETFVTADDNMLPPDNFQEDPSSEVAHRTSPTNIGLYLLCVVCARDFGWIGAAETIERLEATLATMARMPRFRGHFYNWYDTRDLKALEPKYISSVDSGNLAGHLIAIANSCREWRQSPMSGATRRAGIADALALTAEQAVYLRLGRRTQTVTPRQLEDSLAAMTKTLESSSFSEETLAIQLTALACEASIIVDFASAIALERSDGSGADLLYWARANLSAAEAHRSDHESAVETAASRHARLLVLENAFRAMAMAMEFGFLFDRTRQLLSIGFLISDSTLDPNCYDLLASEARLASFFAIAKGDIPARHWFRLGRAETPVTHGTALISWSGSMFEYLMPPLVMRAPARSLLEQTDRLVVLRQIEYGEEIGLPWGISESAYNARDLELTYQYSNFGVPGLGLKRGLGENRVIAPYATGLATMVDPSASAANFERLTAIGARGRYGFYEAVDFTPIRVPEGEPLAIVRAFMAHHQGMTIAGIANAVFDGAMRERFHAEPIVQATELLLQERVPREVASARAWAAEVKSGVRASDADPSGGRRIVSVHQSAPATQLLSNGTYAVMLTAAGSGYSRWGDVAITRWREDATRDDSGSYIFLRDTQSGAVWSAGFQPTGVEPDQYAVDLNEDRVEIVRRDGTLTTTLEVLVSAEDDAEVRRVSIFNAGGRARDIEITSYSELALGPQGADLAHPAFAKMFVETEYLEDFGAILATRRKRTPSEPELWAAHLSVANGEAVGKPEFETDRARFLGRGQGVSAPIAMADTRRLTNSIGAVLDPIFALRRRVRVAARATVRVAFWTMAARTRAALLDCIDKHRDDSAYERATTLAWTQAQVQLHHLGVTPDEAGLFQRLASHVIFAGRDLRPSSNVIRQGSGPQSGLWSLGVSGDLPIMLLRIGEIETLHVARQVLQAHEYWRMKQLAVDLVILNERRSSYAQDLQAAIETLVRASQSRPTPEIDRHLGRVFVLRADLIAPETRSLLVSTARVVLVAQHGSLFDQLERVAGLIEPPRPRKENPLGRPERLAAPRTPALEFFNGLGGFAAAGKEYVTILGPGQSTPAPWINVVANPSFGFQTSAEGGGYTWSANSNENQLTPWSNDPVSDPPGEAFYVRDDRSGDVWSPTAVPIRDPSGVYIARHGRGYSRFEHSAHGVDSDLLQFVPVEGSIKISRLRLTNTSNLARHLSITAYVEWALGASRSATLAFVETERDAETGAIFARNPTSLGFGSRVAFADMRGAQSDWTGDRREFIGRNRTLANPAALSSGSPLSNTVGAALDPCAAMRSKLALQPGGVGEVVFFLGEAATREDARAAILAFRAADLDALEADVARTWDETLSAIEVKTPDRAMDLMLNGWLIYQTLACRIWARSAFYQASGAYGFRDQLQDGMALAAARPDLTREHLLRAAARQFVEGDVQHWWLPHSGQGVRTRISDDRAWLAYTVAQYVETTNDTLVLDELIPFVEGAPLETGETDRFFEPTVSQRSVTLFEHCAIALDASLVVGRHGLPLFGTGDWNDGMNRVGEKGEGESVWLGWFLHAALTGFAQLAQGRNDTRRSETWTAHAAALKEAMEREAWDGGWYRRGYFDDGAPLGSATSEECRIDSIVQSWAVLSGAATPERAARAMAALDKQLIRRDDDLALLFTPPFDKTAPDPGYIRGYPPGVRENGGQYTHAATWSVMAFAALGEGDKAAELFSLLNPINHSRTPADAYRYKVEPYVVCADVYSMAPHVGRGGWTWYTGSAGWLQRAGVESLLGLRLRGPFLSVDPCIPKAWGRYEATMNFRTSRYSIFVENPKGVSRGVIFAAIDGVEISERPLLVPLLDDGGRRRVDVRLG